jgi:patatin-like phospholipase/acyl hydrolase
MTLMEHAALRERIKAPGPKKILALDGGGILGLISVEVLVRIEDSLRDRLRAGPDFVLADYFDFAAGTSTGAITASCISVGMSARKIRDFYLGSGKDMFDRASLLERLHYKYEDEPLARKLKAELGEKTLLGSATLRTLLMMVMSNATTDSPWSVTNNPFAKYNSFKRADGSERDDCNLLLPLWQLVRASTAAPTYFPPETVMLGTKRFVFVDGGITTYNNPAFLAFVTATAEPYGIRWKTGERDLLLVSIGTGTSTKEDYNLSTWNMHVIHNARTVPSTLMNAAHAGQDLYCRVFGRCLVGEPIDREVGDLIGAAGPTSPKLFTYLRYDPSTTRNGLTALGLPDIDPVHIQTLDSIDHIDEIQRVGARLAERKVNPEHFDGFV